MNVKTTELREKDVIELPSDQCVVLSIKEGQDKSLSKKKKTVSITVRMLSGPFKNTEGTFIMISDEDVNVIKRHGLWSRFVDWLKSFNGNEIVFKQKKDKK